MSDLSPDTLKAIYFAVIGVFTVLLAWSGWRQGVLRQLMTLTAIVSAYLMAWYAGGYVEPAFNFLRYPEPLTHLIGSTVAGLATFIAIRTLRQLLFKKAAQQRPGAWRTSSSTLGAMLGVVFGGLLFLLSSDLIRMLGTFARMHVEMAEAIKALPPPPTGQGQLPALPVQQPNAIERGLAKLSGALESGGTGELLKQYDPVPIKVYATVAKLALVVANPDALDVFLAYPGVQKLANHPKLVALRNDPSVSALLASNSYLKLLRHDKVVSLASDPDFVAEIKKIDFSDALDAAWQKHLQKPGTPSAPPTPAPPAAQSTAPEPTATAAGS